ncbi:MAG: hypothetical protein ACJ740_18125 [Gaiellales bacterium]|jgi:hypothetical protein
MKKIGIAIERLQAAELELADGFRKVGQRHAVEHDLYHLTETLATQCEAHVQRLHPFAQRYEAPRDHDTDTSPLAEILNTARLKLSEAIGRQPAGIVLLDDLRHLFVTTQDVGVLWVIIAQAAQALRDAELLALCTESHTESIAQMHWLLTRIKTAAPQTLTV